MGNEALRWLKWWRVDGRKHGFNGRVDVLDEYGRWFILCFYCLLCY